jgi:hypothetical protein
MRRFQIAFNHVFFALPMSSHLITLFVERRSEINSHFTRSTEEEVIGIRGNNLQVGTTLVFGACYNMLYRSVEEEGAHESQAG